jgi:predicted phosphoribosyltransferase
MYFKSRVEAGVKLAEQLMQYRYENTAVVALDAGGVRVGYQIAANLHSTLNELISQSVRIEDETIEFATVLPGGVVAENPELSQSEQDYYYGEYHGQIDEAEREATLEINRVLGEGGDLDLELLRERVVIVVSDGLADGHIVEAAIEFLKPVRVEKIVMAVPVASVAAVDKMHILADELHVLNVTGNFISTDHYYEANDEPNREEIKRLIDRAILGWE